MTLDGPTLVVVVTAWHPVGAEVFNGDTGSPLALPGVFAKNRSGKAGGFSAYSNL